MSNLEKNIDGHEDDAIRRLLGQLKRVEAPKDFDFRVRARIATGQPSEVRRSWLPAIGRVAVPLLLLVTLGGYFGYRSFLDAEPSTTNVAVIEPAAVPAEPNDVIPQPPTVQPVVETPIPVNETIAQRTETKTQDPADAPKQSKKSAPDPKVGKPAGGSYDVAGTGSRTITPETDIDVLAPANAPKRPIVSAGAFLASAGITATSTGRGGRITAVGGKAAAAGVRVGDVIESVNVQTGVVRVNRDGRSMAFALN